MYNIMRGQQQSINLVGLSKPHNFSLCTYTNSAISYQVFYLSVSVRLFYKSTAAAEKPTIPWPPYLRKDLVSYR